VIYFTQTDILWPEFHFTWRASAGRETVATIEEIEEGAVYKITYRRLPGRPRTQPKSTTRTVRGDLDHAQALIQKRGWRKTVCE
jgi:hypothetical protein